MEFQQTKSHRVVTRVTQPLGRPHTDSFNRILCELHGRQVADLCRPGSITLVQGPTASGKTELLTAVAARLGRACIRLEPLSMPKAHLFDAFPKLEALETLELLAKFGLGEPACYLARPEQLTSSQRHRLAFALAYARLPENGVLLADDFAAGLDSVTASILAFQLTRLFRKSSRYALLVASTHTHFARPLAPDLLVTCDFGHYTLEPRETP